MLPVLSDNISFTLDMDENDKTRKHLEQKARELKMVIDDEITTPEAREDAIGELEKLAKLKKALRSGKMSPAEKVVRAVRRAIQRLTSRERLACTFTAMPLGPCRRLTAEEGLLIFCPPAPEPSTKRSSRSSSRTPAARIRSRICVIVPGLM